LQFTYFQLTNGLLVDSLLVEAQPDDTNERVPAWADN
jgi:hypothetical protein